MSCEHNDVVEVSILFAIVGQNGDTELQHETNAVHPAVLLDSARLTFSTSFLSL